MVKIYQGEFLEVQMEPWIYETMRRHQIEILEWARREHESKRVLISRSTWMSSIRIRLANALIRLGLRLKAAVPGASVYPGDCTDLSAFSLRNT
jgi:hypothetical protein